MSCQLMHCGKGADGRWYSDFKAKCHGREEVLRLKGLRFNEHGLNRWEKAQDIASIIALPFFAESTTTENH